jgi:hypothetical protein
VRFRFVGGLGAPPRRLVTVESGGGGGGNESTEEGGVPVKAVPPEKGRGSARHSNAGPNEASLGSSLFALSLCDSRHGPVGVMLAFGCILFGHLVSSFHDGRVVISVCVRGVRFRFVGGLGAPSRRLATVESGGGGGGNEPTEEGGVPVKAVPPAKGRGSARHSNAGPIRVSLGSSLFALFLCLSAWARGLDDSFWLEFSFWAP